MSFLLPQLPPTFAAALRDVGARKPDSRVAAATRLGAAEGPDRAGALSGLLQLAQDRDARVRAAAMRAFAELADPGAATELRSRLNDPDALVRELALIALSALDTPLAREALREAASSPHPELRFQALAGLAELGHPGDLSLAADLLRDTDAQVRAHAARNLFRFGSAARQALHDALRDADAAVRTGAALSLARLGDETGASALPAALQDPELVFDALDAIAELKLTALREPTAAIAQSVLRPLIWKAAAARTLIRLEDPRGVEALLRVLRAFRSSARSYAVRVVGELGVDELTGELLRLTRRFRGTDPETLIEALARLVPRNQRARAGLEALARRSDQAGVEARRVLATLA